MVENAFLGEASRFYGEIIQQDAKAVEKYKERGVIVSQIPKDIEDQMAKLSDKMYKERGSKDSFYEKVLNSRHKFQQNIMETYDRL